ncbi:hypothetical protein PDQ34_22855 [Bacillus cereus]|nr:hypothetical protein [Bacillus cereus]MDA2571901.1 hypothetical protein [Bacillus cereus]
MSDKKNDKIIRDKVATIGAISVVIISIITLFILPYMFPDNTLVMWIKNIVGILWILGLTYDFMKKRAKK